MDNFKNARGVTPLNPKYFLPTALVNFDSTFLPAAGQKWHLQKSASDDEVKIELRPVLAQFKANLSFPTPGMLLSGL